jgi:MFS transporter, SHS family, lactate transporter
VLLQVDTPTRLLYHQGAVWGGLVGPVLAAWAQPPGFAIPMLIVTIVAEAVFIFALLIGLETKGKVLISDLEFVDAQTR